MKTTRDALPLSSTSYVRASQAEADACQYRLEPAGSADPLDGPFTVRRSCTTLHLAVIVLLFMGISWCFYLMSVAWPTGDQLEASVRAIVLTKASPTGEDF